MMSDICLVTRARWYFSLGVPRTACAFRKDAPLRHFYYMRNGVMRDSPNVSIARRFWDERWVVDVEAPQTGGGWRVRWYRMR
ncbi:hypothetical protein BDN70DRAFT_47712 [Pholiota conissans]|uniref:Uncharacterized protein n=1 Tax=Pholiota conissans TaxID=109636 RepID=A0A9P6CZK7_9AGAR|nr:hypothetical protein BDN70DRAFT_47712 [Pholiota conissans]